MRLEQLDYLLAVVQHGSLRRAADSLHVSQPAVSEALDKLERELGVPLLERRRSGTRISADGRELLDAVTDVLEAVERLREQAGERRGRPRPIRVGTVNTATSSLVAPAVRDLHAQHPDIGVEVMDLQQREIQAGVVDGALDLGLVNLLPGDELPIGLVPTVLVHGTPVVVLPAGHPLVERRTVTVEELRAERLVSMRAGYVMHRYAHRLFGGDAPVTAWSADGAAMGKQLVADGLGITLLPDYSVAGDPLERAGLITTRPVAGDRTTISLVLLQRHKARPTGSVRALVEALVHRARPALDTGWVEPVKAHR